MKKTAIFILVLIGLFILAWSLSMRASADQAGLSKWRDNMQVAPPGSTPTPTPFQPIPPTPLYIPTDMAPSDSSSGGQDKPDTVTSPTSEASPWGDYAGPTIWPDIEVPEPMGILPHPEGQVNILLLGSDQRPDDGGFRTDTIQLLTINPHEGSVKLTAFPRDLYVYIPGYTVQRINTAMGWGGFEALATTMEYNFGVHPEYYVLINFWSFKDVIDSLGGVTVDIGMDLCDQRDSYESFCVYQGSMWMDSETALWYVRSRYSTGDLDRGRRQQEVLEAIFERLLALDGLQRAPELYDIYQRDVTTNLNFDTLYSLLPIASHLTDTQTIGRYYLGEGEMYDWTNTYGAMVMVPIREAVLEVMRQVISEP